MLAIINKRVILKLPRVYCFFNLTQTLFSSPDAFKTKTTIVSFNSTFLVVTIFNLSHVAEQGYKQQYLPKGKSSLELNNSLRSNRCH